jgi:predicted molibdopterin-dependent oxidoreductase YjgC
MRLAGEEQRSGRSEHGTSVTVQVDGRPVRALAGQTVAAVLLSMGQRTFRHTATTGAPRGLFCGMGVCFDCLVTVDGLANVRACVTLVQDGMAIETGGADLD